MQHNPFSTRFTRPGAMPFLSAEQLDLSSIAARFAANGYRGQIVGPHGCGKTTLTFGLQSQLGQQIQAVRRVTIRHDRAIIATETDWRDRNPQLLVIDGVERMTTTQRWLMIQSCRNLRMGILVTTHKRINFLPVLCEIQPTLETLQRIVEHLAPDVQIESEYLNTTWSRSGGNIREALMDLYDWYESSQKSADSRDLGRVISSADR
jgi:hypothetical protein